MNAVDFLTGRRARPAAGGSDAGARRRNAGRGRHCRLATARALRRAAEALDSGRAAEAFGRMVAALGGPADFVENAGDLPAEGAGRACREGAERTALSPASPPATSASPSWRSAAAAPRPTTRSTMRSASPGCCRSARSGQGASRCASSMRARGSLAEKAAAGNPRGLHASARRKPAADKAIVRRIAPRG